MIKTDNEAREQDASAKRDHCRHHQDQDCRRMGALTFKRADVRPRG
jgi:hypothetical protein